MNATKIDIIIIFISSFNSCFNNICITYKISNKSSFCLKGAGASIAAAGKVSLLPIVGGFTGKIKVAHADLVRMLHSFGIDYRPGGKLGGLDLQSEIKADMNGLQFSNLNGLIGPVKMAGTAEISLTEPRTKLSADLNTGKIVADRFLPVTKNALLTDQGSILPASFSAPRGALKNPPPNAP